jgi:hypothetical protein
MARDTVDDTMLTWAVELIGRIGASIDRKSE